jgi:hypothetical protein
MSMTIWWFGLRLSDCRRLKGRSRYSTRRFEFAGNRSAYAKQAIRDKLADHKQLIARYGDDMPEITGWRWGHEAASAHRRGFDPCPSDS